MQVKVNADVEGTFTIENLEMGRMFQFCQIYAICFCVLMLVLQVLQHRDLVIQKKMAVNQTLWEQRQMQYQISKENIDLINRKCHDMKHQIAALMQMGGDNLQREQFVEDVQNMIEIYDSAPDTGNEVLNTILAQRSLYCNMHNIQWSCMADGTVLTFMENIDLYTLMASGRPLRSFKCKTPFMAQSRSKTGCRSPVKWTGKTTALGCAASAPLQKGTKAARPSARKTEFLSSMW
jgi:hypothetical protein